MFIIISTISSTGTTPLIAALTLIFRITPIPWKISNLAYVSQLVKK